jgi:hypothetical protein
MNTICSSTRCQVDEMTRRRFFLMVYNECVYNAHRHSTQEERESNSLSLIHFLCLTYFLSPLGTCPLSLSRFLNLWLVSRSLLGSFLMFLLFLLPVCLSVRLPGFRHNWIGTSSVRKESGSLIARTVGKCGIILTPGATFTKIHLLRYLRMGPIS